MEGIIYIAIKYPLRTIKAILKIKERLWENFVIEGVFIRQSYRWLVQDLKPNTVAIDMGDNLEIMNKFPDRSVDLIYADPLSSQISTTKAYGKMMQK